MMKLDEILYVPTNQILKIRNCEIDVTYKPLIMGILNRTTDSFYDHGEYFNFDDFLKKAESLLADGADILDIGGVKAGSGEPVSLDEELERVVPAVEALNQRFDALISVDTWNSKVLEESAKVGASIGNDISGFSDPNYLEVASKYNLAVVATHIRLQPRIDDPNPIYRDIKNDVLTFLENKVSDAIKANIDIRSIMIDLGLDLGKTSDQSLQLFKMSTFYAANLKLPMFLSASNKGFLGDILNLEIRKRTHITNAAVAFGYLAGNRVFRVHDVSSAVLLTNSLKYIVTSKLRRR
jgi:dihydropteroate synthase